MRRDGRTGRTNRRWRMLVAALAAATVLAACRGGSGPPAPTATPPAPAAGAASATPVFGSPIAPPPTPLPIERGTADTADGIGIYPTLLTFPDTLRGRDYFGTVGVINGGPRERTYRFETEGATAPWISFVSAADRTTPLQQISIPAHDRVQVTVRAVVPPSVPNGQYAGTIRVITTGSVAPNATATGPGVGVNLGGEVSVALAVTGTERIEGQFIEASASDVESGYPLRIQSALLNSGNVEVRPTIDIGFTGGFGNPVDRMTVDDRVVNPGERKQLVIEWPTTGKPLGLVVARMHVAYGALDLGTRELRFNIVAAGTFSRRAELGGVRLTNQPQPGELAKLVATFKNTGQIDTRGKFVGELYLGDRLVESLTSPEQLLLPGGSGELEVLARVAERGTYTVRGKINYEGRETDVQQVTFRVGAEGGGLAPWMLVGGAGAAAVLLVVAAGGWLWLRRARGRPAAPQA